MQTITPVGIHIENEWSYGSNSRSHVKKDRTTVNRGGRQAARMRTCVASKLKSSKTKNSHIPQQVVQTKQVLPVHSRSPSPNREPWIPPPGRSTKGQKFAWQSSKARLEVNPLPETSINHDIDDESRENVERDKQKLPNQTTSFSTEQNEKLIEEMQTYEKRVHGLTEGVEMLKERTRNPVNKEQTNHIRADINSCLYDPEQPQQIAKQTTTTPSQRRVSRSLSPLRNSYRSSILGEQRNHRLSPRISFEDDPFIERRRARSTTPIRGSFSLNPDRERLLISLSESEVDIAQITKQLSSVKDILTKLKLENQPVSFEVEQLYQQRNQLLRLIEQFEYSNNKLKDFLRHQYHLEAEHGIINDKHDTLLTRIHELENENGQIRRLLLNRENDNITLQTELERLKTHTIGFDTMKTSLEHNRAHLQRELYAKEGEINRLQCALRSLERDLQRSRSQCDSIQRAIKRTPMFPISSRCSLPNVVTKTKGMTIEKLQEQLNDRDHKIDELEKTIGVSRNEQIVDTNLEVTRLRTRLDHAERLVAEYKEQLYTQTLKTSADNSKAHLSEIELEKMRIRLQKRIEELEPLPELLRQTEMKNQELQTRILEQEKRLAEQAAFISELNSKINAQHHVIDRMKENHFSFDDDYRALQQKINALQRQIITLEDGNATLLRNLNAKEEALRSTQSRLNSKTHELTSMNKQIDLTQADFKAREDTFDSKERVFQQRASELEQQLSKLRLECNQLKREKDEIERRYTSQLGELRDKLEQSNNNNRSMQNYVNSLKTTYASVFNDTVPSPFTTTSFTRFTTTPNAYP